MLRRGRRVAPAVVWIPSEVEREHEREADRCSPLETGGVLLGYEDTEEREQLQLVTTVGPGPRAAHRRHRFKPDSAWQRDRIATIYRNSGNVVTYLGDWHSHPHVSGKPSRLDRGTARRIARFTEARVPHPLMLIVSGGQDSWALHAYRYERRQLQYVDLWPE